MNWVLALVAALAVLRPVAWAQSETLPPRQSSTTSFRVAGTVVSKTNGHPLAGTRVSLVNVKNPRQQESIVTRDDGKFEFTSVPAGKFSLNGARRGFISAGYDQHDQYSSAIVTGAAIDTENLVLKLAPRAVISGRVLDESGEPIRHARITVYSDSHQDGVHRILPSHNGQTDDLGAYEVPLLNPGTYYLSVQAEPWYAVHPDRDSPQSQAMVDPGLDVAYPITYYPDVTDPDSATPISIRGGENLQVDLHLSPVPSLRVIIHMPSLGQHQFSFPRLEQTAFGDSVPALNRGTRMISPGTWEVSGVAAGRYNIRMMGAATGSEINGVDLSGNHELDASTGEALCTVKASVTLPDSISSTQFFIGLRRRIAAFPEWCSLIPKDSSISKTFLRNVMKLWSRVQGELTPSHKSQPKGPRFRAIRSRLLREPPRRYRLPQWSAAPKCTA